MKTSFLPRLEACFRDRILALPYLPKTQGSAFDLVVRNTIERETNIPCITSESWTSQEDYAPFRQAVRKRLDRAPVATKAPIVVAQPNGSQQWPDLAIIYGHNIAYIEFKTNKNDKIVWNSGLPRRDGLYLFNSGLKARKQTTAFLGHHVLPDSDRALLEQAAKAAAAAAASFNDRLKNAGSSWNHYARAMFNCSAYYLRHPDVQCRENEAIAFLIHHLGRMTC